jgi:hypothetical protein
MLSYNGNVTISLMTDNQLIPDPENYAWAIKDEIKRMLPSS